MGTTQVKNGFQGGTDDQLLVNPDGSINVNGGGAGVPVNVNVVSSVLPTGAATSANQLVEISLLTSIDGKIVHVDTGNVTVVASALPTGAATSANQTSEIALLTSIDSKLTSPIAVTGPLTDAQLRASPVPVTATITGTPNVTVVNGAGASAVNIQDGGNSITVDGSLGRTWTLSSGTDSVSAVQSGTWNITNITGTISLPTGASTSANQTSEIALLTSIDGKLNSLGQKTSAGSVPVVIASDQSAVAVTASITGTPNVNVTNGAGAAAVNIQDGGNSITVDGTVAATQSGTWTTGRTWTLVSGTDSVAAVQSGTWNINNITGTVSLPTGAATETTLSAINAKLNSLGQKTSANSVPVVIASDQSAIATTTTITGTPNVNVTNAGGASAVNIQDGGNSITVDQATAANFNAQVVGNVADNGVDSGNPVKVGAVFNSTVPAATYASGDRSDLQSDIVGNLFVNASGRKPTYCTATTFTAAATATDAFILNGSATKTIKIRQVTISGTNTGNTNALIDLVKRSTANTGGTSTAGTAVPNDSNSAAATATSNIYTANPTLGTTVGVVATAHMFFPTLASTNAAQFREFQLFSNISEPIVLRGTAQGLSINLRGVSLGGTTVLAVKIEWTEE